MDDPLPIMFSFGHCCYLTLWDFHGRRCGHPETASHEVTHLRITLSRACLTAKLFANSEANWEETGILYMINMAVKPRR